MAIILPDDRVGQAITIGSESSRIRIKTRHWIEFCRLTECSRQNFKWVQNNDSLPHPSPLSGCDGSQLALGIDDDARPFIFE